MTDTYSTYDAKAKLSEILRKVESGRVVRISRNGRPIAEVRPIPARGGELIERLTELMDRGVIVEARVPAGAPQPVAHVPGALQRFLAERD